MGISWGFPWGNFIGNSWISTEFHGNFMGIKHGTCHVDLSGTFAWRVEKSKFLGVEVYIKDTLW